MNARMQIAALAALGALAGQAGAQEPPPAAFEGAWRFVEAVVIVELDPAPERMIGSVLAFGPDAVEAPHPFGCDGARYEALTVPVAGMFQGVFGEEVAERFGLAGEIETMRVACSTGGFDYHLSGGRLLTALDGVIHVLER